MTTIYVDPDPMPITMTALCWQWRGEEAAVRRHLNRLTPTEKAEARMQLLRLALRIQAMTPEGVAAAVLDPDSLPEAAS